MNDTAVNFLLVDREQVLALPVFLQDGSLGDSGSLTCKPPTGNTVIEASTDESQ